MKTKILLILFILFLQIHSFAQNRFEGSVVAGMNYSELEGSSIIDYFGPNVGLIGTANLSNRLQLSMELLFSQNGEYILPVSYPRIDYGKIRLNHVEVPLRFNWLVNKNKESAYYNLSVNMGIAYTYLINHYAEDFENNDVTNQIIYDKRNNFLFQPGVDYYFNENWGFNFKLTIPFTAELDATWTLRMVYRIR